LHRVNNVNAWIRTSRAERRAAKAGVSRTNLDPFWHLGPGKKVAKKAVSQDGNSHVSRRRRRNADVP